MYLDLNSELQVQVQNWVNSDMNDAFLLYKGTVEDIIAELKAWVLRQKHIYKSQMVTRDVHQRMTLAMLDGKVEFPDRDALRRYGEKVLERIKKTEVCGFGAFRRN